MKNGRPGWKQGLRLRVLAPSHDSAVTLLLGLRYAQADPPEEVMKVTTGVGSLKVVLTPRKA